MNHKSNMNVGGESDGRVVPAKRPNKGGKPSAEGAEGRRPTKENTEQTTASQTQSWGNALSGLHRVREAARRDKRLQFTALLHHVTVPLLLDSFYALKRDAAPGVDGLTWKEYETDLDKRLEIYTDVCTGGRIERDLPREPTYPKRMDDSGHWALLPWRTKSSNRLWERSLGRSTKRTFWDSRTGSGLGVSTLRWMRYGSGL